MNNLQLSVLLNAIDRMSTPVRNASKSVNELSKKLKENNAAQFQLLKQNRENENAIKKYTATLNPLKNKLAELNQTLQTAKQQAAFFEQQLANSTNPTAEFKAKVEMAKNAVKRLKEEQQQAALKLRTARAELQKSGISAKQLGSKQNELRQKIKATNTQIQKQKTELERLNDSQVKYQQYRHKVEHLKNLSGNVQMMGAAASAAGATITTPIVGIVKEHMSFEDAMVGVARQVQGLKDSAGNFTPEFDEWKNKIKALSEELPLTTVEIANMIEAAARMDIPKEALEDFVRLNTQMATAFDATNPDELVEKFGKVSKNFKLTTQQTKELADAINYLDDNAISKGTNIIGFMNRVSGVTGIAKITEKNLAALGSTLQTAGAEEESSATAVNAIFTRLSSSSKTKPVSKALAAIGLSANKVELGMVKDAQGTIMKIVDALKKMPEQKRLGLIGDLVGKEHAKTLALLVSNTEEWKRQIALANSEDAKGSMGREFDTRMKAMSASFVLFQNSIFNLKASLGSALAPTLTVLMDKIRMVLGKVQQWIQANPELTSKIMMTVAVLGGSLTIFGAFASILSFMFYPILRLALGFGKLKIILNQTGINILSIKKTFTGFTSLLRVGIRGLFSPLRILPMLFSPIGLAIMGVALMIYKYWQPIKAFFGGFWEGLKAGLAPVIEKFKPLGDIFKVVVGWIEKAVKWFMDLFEPVKSTSEELESAANAGKKFGEWSAKSFELALLPLQLLIDGIKWVIDNMPSLDKIGENITKHAQANQQKVDEYWGKGSFQTAQVNAVTGLGNFAIMSNPQQKWTGGYTGNGNKYDPAGIVHRGEFVFNKSATSTLGVGFLSTLHNAKSARAGMLAVGLASGMAMAQPFQIDNRPPVAVRTAPAQNASPMNVQITINGANGSPQDIANAVRQELAKLQNREQAKARSSLRDRG